MSHRERRSVVEPENQDYSVCGFYVNNRRIARCKLVLIIFAGSSQILTCLAHHSLSPARIEMSSKNLLFVLYRILYGMLYSFDEETMLNCLCACLNGIASSLNMFLTLLIPITTSRGSMCVDGYVAVGGRNLEV